MILNKSYGGSFRPPGQVSLNRASFINAKFSPIWSENLKTGWREVCLFRGNWRALSVKHENLRGRCNLLRAVNQFCRLQFSISDSRQIRYRPTEWCLKLISKDCRYHCWWVWDWSWDVESGNWFGHPPHGCASCWAIWISRDSACTDASNLWYSFLESTLNFPRLMQWNTTWLFLEVSTVVVILVVFAKNYFFKN